MSQSPEGPCQARRGFEEDAQAGLTLVELLVVLLVVAVLLAIALPPRLSTAKTAQKAAPANLLYTNGHDSRLGVCSGKTMPIVTAIDDGLGSSTGAASTPMRTRSTTAGRGGDRPGTTECRTPAERASTQPTGSDVAGKTGWPPGGTCGVFRQHTRPPSCRAGSNLAGTGYPSAQST
jgi:prepilin-type N-terminal cleavage/methylation domain-containing protein